MKKLFAYIIFVIITGISTYFIYSYVQSSKYADTAIPYIQKVLPQISIWDAAIVKQYMTPEILQTVPDENLKNLMLGLSRLGTLKSIGEFSFQGSEGASPATFGDIRVITYEIETEYSTGKAIVTLKLLVRGGSYEIYHFNFQSEALSAG